MMPSCSDDEGLSHGGTDFSGSGMGFALPSVMGVAALPADARVAKAFEARQISPRRPPVSKKRGRSSRPSSRGTDFSFALLQSLEDKEDGLSTAEAQVLSNLKVKQSHTNYSNKASTADATKCTPATLTPCEPRSDPHETPSVSQPMPSHETEPRAAAAAAATAKNNDNGHVISESEARRHRLSTKEQVYAKEMERWLGLQPGQSTTPRHLRCSVPRQTRGAGRVRSKRGPLLNDVDGDGEHFPEPSKENNGGHAELSPRDEFFGLLHTAHRTVGVEDPALAAVRWPTESGSGIIRSRPGFRPTTARTTYLRKCDLLGMIPEPILVYRDAAAEADREINLKNFGLGDAKLADAAAASFELLPDVRRLILAGNRLTDRGAAKLLAAVERRSKSSKDGMATDSNGEAQNALAVLDLSENRIGTNGGRLTAAALVRLLTLPQKTLVSLDLRNNRLVSAPIVTLAQAVSMNTSLTSLDLSFNHVGSAGASALADTLRCNRTLRELRLGWSRIRGVGMVELLAAIYDNKRCALRSLDLSNNAIGARGTHVFSRTVGGGGLLAGGPAVISEEPTESTTLTGTYSDSLAAMITAATEQTAEELRTGPGCSGNMGIDVKAESSVDKGITGDQHAEAVIALVAALLREPVAVAEPQLHHTTDVGEDVSTTLARDADSDGAVARYNDQDRDGSDAADGGAAPTFEDERVLQPQSGHPREVALTHLDLSHNNLDARHIHVLSSGCLEARMRRRNMGLCVDAEGYIHQGGDSGGNPALALSTSATPAPTLEGKSSSTKAEEVCCAWRRVEFVLVAPVGLHVSLHLSFDSPAWHADRMEPSRLLEEIRAEREAEEQKHNLARGSFRKRPSDAGAAEKEAAAAAAGMLPRCYREPLSRYTIERMCPPSQIAFFFSVDGTPILGPSPDDDKSDFPLPLLMSSESSMRYHSMPWRNFRHRGHFAIPPPTVAYPWVEQHVREDGDVEEVIHGDRDVYTVPRPLVNVLVVHPRPAASQDCGRSDLLSLGGSWRVNDQSPICLPGAYPRRVRAEAHPHRHINRNKSFLVAREPPWKPSNSMLSSLKAPAPALLERAFYKDLEYSKIREFVKCDINTIDFPHLRKVLQDHYVFLVSVFRFYSAVNAGGGQQAFSMSLNAFTDFCSHCYIIDDRFCKLSDVDTIFIAANVTKKGLPRFANNPERSLTRFEFMEAVVRLACAKFGKTGEEVQDSECVYDLITRHILPHAHRRHSAIFRTERMLTKGVHELLNKETPLLRKVFNANRGKYAKPGNASSADMSLDEWVALMVECELVDEDIAEGDGRRSPQKDLTRRKAMAMVKSSTSDAEETAGVGTSVVGDNEEKRGADVDTVGSFHMRDAKLVFVWNQQFCLDEMKTERHMYLSWLEFLSALGEVASFKSNRRDLHARYDVVAPLISNNEVLDEPEVEDVFCHKRHGKVRTVQDEVPSLGEGEELPSIEPDLIAVINMLRQHYARHYNVGSVATAMVATQLAGAAQRKSKRGGGKGKSAPET